MHFNVNNGDTNFFNKTCKKHKRRRVQTMDDKYEVGNEYLNSCKKKDQKHHKQKHAVENESDVIGHKKFGDNNDCDKKNSDINERHNRKKHKELELESERNENLNECILANRNESVNHCGINLHKQYAVENLKENCFVGHKHIYADNNYDTVEFKSDSDLHNNCRKRRHKNIEIKILNKRKFGTETIANNNEPISYQRKKKHKKQKIENVNEQTFDSECTFESNSASMRHYDFYQDKETHMKYADRNTNGSYIVGHEHTCNSNIDDTNCEYISPERNFKKKKHKHKKVNNNVCTFVSSAEFLHQDSDKEKLTAENMTSSPIANDVSEKKNCATSVNQRSQRKKKFKKQKIETVNEQNFDIECIFENNNASISHYDFKQDKESHMKYTDENINGRYIVGHEHISHNNRIAENNCESIISERNFRRKKHKHKNVNDNVSTFVNSAESLHQDNCKEKHTIENITNSHIAKDVFETKDPAASVNQRSQTKKKRKKEKIENVDEQNFDVECIFESNGASINHCDFNQDNESHMKYGDKNTNESYIVGHEHPSHSSNVGENNCESITFKRNFRKKKYKHKDVNAYMSTFVNSAESLYQGSCKEKHTIETITNSHIAKDVFEIKDSAASVNQRSQTKKKRRKKKIENVDERSYDIECMFESNSASIGHYDFNQDKESRMKYADKNTNESYIVGHEHSCNNNSDDNNYESIAPERNFRKRKHKHKKVNNVCTFVNSAESVHQDSYKEKLTAENMSNSHIANDVSEKNYCATSVNQRSQTKKKHKKKKIENVDERNFDIECIFESNSASMDHYDFNLDKESHMKYTDENINGRYIVGHEHTSHNNSIAENNCESIISERNFRRKKHKHKNVNDNVCTFVNCDESVHQDSCKEKLTVENVTNRHIAKDVVDNNDTVKNSFSSIISQRSKIKKKHKKHAIENLNEQSFDEECISVINKESVNFESNTTFQPHEYSKSIRNDQYKSKGEKDICDLRQINDSSESPFISTMKIVEPIKHLNIPSQNFKKKFNQERFDQTTSAMATNDITVQKSLKTVIQDRTLYLESSPIDFTRPLLELDLIEDPVDFEIPPLHMSETVCSLSENQKLCLKAEGVSIKSGRFTAVEDSIILKNFKDFFQKYGISDSLELFGIGRYKKDYRLLEFIRAKHFYVKLGKGLSDRTLYSIYQRARLLLHPSRNLGKVDVDDVRAIKQLHTQIGRKWNLIGDALQKSGENCLQIYRWHEDNVSKGKWTAEEEKSLIEAIKKVTGSSDISCENIQSISWEEVAAHVPTRNFSQCRMYWASHLAWKENSLKNKWDKKCSLKLIHILSEDWNVADTSMIDWKKIHECFENVAPSPVFLQKRWLYLKSRIPGHKNMTYENIIKKLCIRYHLDSYDIHK